MIKNNRTRWFPAKSHGWGWGLPSVWQGWVVLIIFIASVSILPYLIDPIKDQLFFWSVLIGLSGTFIGVCYAKGAPPKWRWGNSSDEKKKNPE